MEALARGTVCAFAPRMAALNAYQMAVMLDWRHRALERGEHANRVIPVGTSIEDRPAGCLGCFRDGRTLRAIGHRTGCVVGAAGSL